MTRGSDGTVGMNPRRKSVASRPRIIVEALHGLGIHRFCRRTFERNEPWLYNTATSNTNEVISYTLNSDRPPKEVHS